MKNSAAHTFSDSEHAFVLRSLEEVVKVWKTGSSQASFSLDVKEGAATLQLSFQLGSPDNLHSEHLKQPVAHHHHHVCDVNQQTRPTWRRHKGPARRQKDRARAAAYRASRSLAAVTAEETTTAAVASPASIIPVKLPFAGNILPIKSKNTPPASSVSTTFDSITSPPPSTYAAAVLAAPPPIKKVGIGRDVVPGLTVEKMSSAKKKLFQPQGDHHQPPAHQLAQNSEQVQRRNNFKKTEEDLFKKLFP